jgi:photosystem II stability/assembly factor-like uncharacterized protein
MATTTKRRSAKAPLRSQGQRPSRWPYGVALAAAIGLAVVFGVVLFRGSSDDGTKVSAGLPHTPDYHSLLVDPADPRKLVLGTHVGLYVSSDGGRRWRFDALRGKDAMNLARPAGDTVWLAGHNVFKKSVDGGETWTDVRPSGLPGLDIHGFAVDPRNPQKLYAAVAGQGLYRSDDGGDSFALASEQVGGAVFALAVMPDGRILAGDLQQGLLESRDRGGSWMRRLQAQVVGLAVNRRDPQRVLATGSGIALSTNGGRTWRSVFDLPDGAGPVAWSKSNPTLAYVVGFDRTLYRSSDGGASWQPVGGELTAMLQYVLAACALACPISMAAMVWLMRGHKDRDREE